MPQNDPYGLELSSAGAAFEAWHKGFEASLSFDASGILELSQAVELDPEFALAHATLARQQIIHGQREQGQQSLATALQQLDKVNDREASQIKLTAQALRGQSNALQLALDHLEKWPLDVFVFAQIVGPFGMLAFSGRQDWREQCLNLLEQYRKKFPSNDWWFLAAHAFALAETGDLVQAGAIAEQAWAIAHNGSCAHSLSHVHFERCALDDGIAFIDHWVTNHGGNNSDMRHHLKWHEALYNMELGNTTSDSISQLYTLELDPKVSDPLPLSTYSDNASLLWRCALNKFSVPEKFHLETHSYGQHHYPQAGFPFADIHTIVITVLLKDEKLNTQLAADLNRIEDKHNQHLLGTLLDGITAFVKENYAESANTLETVLADSVCLGGSNPQRRMVEETYLEACIRADKIDVAINLLHRRLQSRSSPYDSGLVEHLQAKNAGGEKV